MIPEPDVLNDVPTPPPPEESSRLARLVITIIGDGSIHYVFTFWLAWILKSIFDFSFNVWLFWLGSVLFYVALYAHKKEAAGRLLADHFALLLLSSLYIWIFN